MKLNIPKGKYIIAVSGGVDSMTLLYLINKQYSNKYQFIVAHFNHGIREDSKLDEDLVRRAAKDYGYVFELGGTTLGPNTSENDAREHRMKFLMHLKDKYKADKIITAHHKDDLIETALINIVRGTNRRGISALINSRDFLRPLIDYTKEDILAYAISNGIEWHEDSTNSEDKYLRNYLRKNILVNLPEDQKEKISKMIELQKDLNSKIDELLDDVLEGNKLNRIVLSQIEFGLVKELILSWIRHNGIYSYDKDTIERISVGALVSKSGKTLDLGKNHKIKIAKVYLEII